MKCPLCKEADLVMISGIGRDPDTGVVDENYCRCPACGEIFDLEDLDREHEAEEKEKQ